MASKTFPASLRLFTFGGALLAATSGPWALPAAGQQLPAGTRSVADEDQDRAEQYKKAQAALDQQNYAEAERLLIGLVKADPKNAGMLYQLAFAQEAQEKDDAAEASYKAAIAVDPKQFESTLALGLIQARKGHLDSARETLQKAVALQPGDAAQARVLKARAYRALAQIDQAKDPAAARDWLVAALKLTPETPEDTLMVAELADAAGDTVDAEAQYKKLMAKGPISPEIAVSYARYLLRHGQAAAATPLLEQLLAANPDDANLKRLLAHLYTQANDPAKAEPMLRAALAATPDDPSLLDDLGSALVLEKKFDEAQQVFT
ncbi:tetratricopeptide repeat protein, partial [Terriglobus sp. YAF25]